MPNKDDFVWKERIYEIVHQMQEDIEYEARRLFHSGGYDFERYRDRDFALPKVLVTAAAHNIAKKYSPVLDKQDMQDVANLVQF